MSHLTDRKRLLVSAFILCSLSTYGSAQEKYPAPIDENFGPVRSIVEWDISSTRSNVRGRRTKRVLRTRESYDRKGQLTDSTVYKDDGEILYGDKHTYDANARLIETNTVHSPFVYLPDKQIYLYDERGKLIETKGFDSSGKHLGGYLYRYDSAGNMIEDRSYQIGTNLVYNYHLRRYVYDKKGNEIGKQQYNSRAGKITPDDFGMGYQRQVVLSDNAGRPVLQGYFKADNTRVKTETIEYDAKGNTVQESEREVGGRLLSRVRYSYVFDGHGNWVKQIRREWIAEGVGTVFEPLEISYRTIRYYRRPYGKGQ